MSRKRKCIDQQNENESSSIWLTIKDTLLTESILPLDCIKIIWNYANITLGFVLREANKLLCELEPIKLSYINKYKKFADSFELCWRCKELVTSYQYLRISSCSDTERAFCDDCTEHCQVCQEDYAFTDYWQHENCQHTEDEDEDEEEREREREQQSLADEEEELLELLRNSTSQPRKCKYNLS